MHMLIFFFISNSVSDTVNTASESTSSNANYPPVAPPRTKRGAPKASTIHTNKALGASSKSPTAQHLKPQGEFMLPSPSSQDNAGASKMHLDSMSLISFDPSVIVNDPQWSPPSTANTQVESRIFQFPPQQPLIKTEDPTWTTLQEPGAGFSSIVPVSSSSPQCSPMAISPSMSTLNTPRGSITSMRSQQSPMDQQHPGQALPDPIMSSYEPFDAAPPAFVSYTTVSHQQSLHNIPSPPRSPVVTSTTSGFGAPSTQHYEDYYTFSSSSAGTAGPVPTDDTCASANPVMFDSMMVTKSEVESPHPVFPNHRIAPGKTKHSMQSTS